MGQRTLELLTEAAGFRHDEAEAMNFTCMASKPGSFGVLTVYKEPPGEVPSIGTPSVRCV